MTHQAGEFISSKSAMEEHPEWRARAGEAEVKAEKGEKGVMS